MKAIVLTGTLLLTVICETQAQRCAIMDSQEEAYARAAAVFVGKVKQKGNIFAMTKMGPVTACLVTYTATFAVEKSYYQVSGPEFTVSSDYPLDDLKEGKTYLVYAYEQQGVPNIIYDYREVKNGLTNPASCSRTRLLSEAGADLPFLDDSNRTAGVTIHGRVTRKTIPLSGIKLEIKGSGQTSTTLTDSEGWYQFPGLSQGKYRVRIKLPWLLRSSRPTRSVTVSDRGRVDETFVVKPRLGW